MPGIFKAPGVDQADKTVYLEPVGPEALFPRDKSDPRKRPEVPRLTVNGEHRALSLRVSFTDIVDGTSNTVMVVEADPKKAVTWTKPDDLEFDVEKPRAGLGGVLPGGFHALLADGSVHLIPLTTDEKVLRDLFNPADGHPIPAALLK
ncbi:MAG TPA: H-X9-DG-CTERM domain-containing protein [Pirellulales bacterium]|jgi:hypothetical protein|nr:H-X9-DG-CTERM domain-containing protein [Pirellulales bacterium]